MKSIKLDELNEPFEVFYIGEDGIKHILTMRG